MLREIELERVDVAECPDDDASAEGCEEFSTGIMLVDLPLSHATGQVLEVDVPMGMYDEIELAIHKPDPVADANFLNARVRGRVDPRGGHLPPRGWRSRDFRFETDLSETLEIELSPPLDVAENVPARITIRLDIATWFVTADGSALIDPRTADTGQLKALVEDNIRNSIEAFQDDDSDGLDDDTEDDDGGSEPDDV